MARNTSTRLRGLSTPSSRGPARDAEDEGPVEFLTFAMAGLIGLVVIMALAVFFGTRRIESNLEARTMGLLASNELTEIEVSASGYDLTLVGTVDRDDVVDRLPDFIIQWIPEVSSVDVERVAYVAFVEPGEVVVQSDPMLFSWEGSAVTVTGTVSDKPTLDSIVAYLEGQFSSVEATGLTIREGVASERDWLPTTLTLVAHTKGSVTDGEVLVNPGPEVIRVSSEMETRQERSDLRAGIEEILSAVTLDFVSGLTVKDAPPPPPEQQVIELQADLDDLIEGKVVEFEDNSDVITPVGRDLLDEILLALAQFPDVPVEIGGHTDSRGSPEYNLDLSRRRAESVLGYLVLNGQAVSRFVVVGYGEEQPMADNATPEGQARNRRIEFIALLE